MIFRKRCLEEKILEYLRHLVNKTFGIRCVGSLRLHFVIRTPNKIYYGELMGGKLSSLFEVLTKGLLPRRVYEAISRTNYPCVVSSFNSVGFPLSKK